MARRTTPVSVTIGTRPFLCTVCQSGWFWKQKVHLTSGTELLAWARQSATGLMCTGCGYLHLFYNDNLEFRTQPGA